MAIVLIWITPGTNSRHLLRARCYQTCSTFLRLRSCAESGTDLVYAATPLLRDVPYRPSVCSYAKPGTDLA
eukprot:1833023-Rhodomonas_salina.3